MTVGQRAALVLPCALVLLPSRATEAGCIDLVARADLARRIGAPRRIALARPEGALVLRRGWGLPVPQPGEPLGTVWAIEPRSELSIPLPEPRTRRVTIRMLPFACPGCGPQRVAIAVNGHDAGTIALVPGFADYSFKVSAASFAYGDNVISFDWAWLRSPAEFDPSSPQKGQLAAAVVSVAFDGAAGNKTPDDRGGVAAPALQPGAIRVDGGTALAYYVRLPPHAVLSGSVARDDVASSPLSAGVARVSIGIDGRAEEDLAVRAIPRFGSVAPFSVDLGPYSERIVRLSFRNEAADSAHLVVRFKSLRLCSGSPFAERECLPLAPPPSPAPAPVPEESGKRSVLVYLMDALRARSLGCYGDPDMASPFLDRISREGWLLARATSQASSTPPSIKALLTGRYLPHTGEYPLATDVPALPDLFARHGYRTMALSSSPWPKAVELARRFEVAPAELATEGLSEWTTGAAGTKTYAGQLTDRLLAELAGDGGRPFFAYLHSLHPHNPYAPPPPWMHLDRPSALFRFAADTQTLLQLVNGREVSPEEIDELRRLYRLDIAYNDYEIGRLAAGLRARGSWDRMLFAFLSDHGEELREHGGYLHGFTSYTEMLEVPVILRATGSLSPAIVGAPTETVDIAPTLTALARLQATSPMDGRALVGLPWHEPRRSYSSASTAPAIYTVIDGPYKYVYAPDNGRQTGMGNGKGRAMERFFLFDLDRDPRELSNLALVRPILAAYMQECLDAWLRASAGQPNPEPQQIDPETKEMLESLGYLTARVAEGKAYGRAARRAASKALRGQENRVPHSAS